MLVISGGNLEPTIKDRELSLAVAVSLESRR